MPTLSQLPKPEMNTHLYMGGSPTKHTAARVSHEDMSSFLAIAKENGLQAYIGKGSAPVKIKKEIPHDGKNNTSAPAKEEKIEGFKPGNESKG